MDLFSNCPRIRKQPPGIVVTTSLLWQTLLLGLSHRKLTVDLKREVACIKSRYLWILKSPKEFPFREVKAVTYGYSTLEPQRFAANYRRGRECYSVGLRWLNDDDFHLFNFVGEGTFSNAGSLLPDWLYWEEFPFSLSSSQASESRAFVDLLSNILDVPVIPSRR